MGHRLPLLILLASALGCDDHLIGECTDPDVRLYEPNWNGVGEFLDKECLTCHGEGGVGGIVLETVIREDLSDEDDSNNVLVIPGDADNSLLWQAIAWEGDASPMPAGAITPLPGCKIDHVKEWIDSGASLAP